MPDISRAQLLIQRAEEEYDNLPPASQANEGLTLRILAEIAFQLERLNRTLGTTEEPTGRID